MKGRIQVVKANLLVLLLVVKHESESSERSLDLPGSGLLADELVGRLDPVDAFHNLPQMKCYVRRALQKLC